jgi:GT2 family glycosyltransferase
MPTVTGAITLYNRAGYISVLLQSLFDSQDGDIEVLAVIVDNGSQDDSVEVAKSFGDRVRVIENNDNRPLTVATNQAIQGALEDERTDYVLVLNDDVALLEGCLRKLVDVCAERKHSLVTPLQLQYDEPHDIDNGAFTPILNMRPLIEDAVLGRPLKPAYETRQIVGAALLASRETFEQLGPFDELFSFYGLDTDYNNRSLHLGYELLLVPAARALHAHGRFMYTQQKDKSTWLRRWRSMLLSRYLLRLKNPSRPLWQNYLLSFWDTVKNEFECGRKLWPAGMWYTLVAQLWTLAKYPAIRAAYRRDFDESKRVR